MSLLFCVFLYVPLQLNNGTHSSITRCSSNSLRSTNLLTSTRFITALSAFRYISMPVVLRSSKGLVVSVPLRNVKRLLRGTGTYMEVDFLNTRSRKHRINFSFPDARAELMSAMSSLEAGMADCNVRSMGEIGSNGKESNSCMHATRSCRHCSSSLIHLGKHSTCFLFRWFSVCQSVVNCPDLGYIVHISGMHQ